jgi:hypothetical protein
VGDVGKRSRFVVLDDDGQTEHALELTDARFELSLSLSCGVQRCVLAHVTI